MRTRIRRPRRFVLVGRPCALALTGSSAPWIPTNTAPPDPCSMPRFRTVARGRVFVGHPGVRCYRSTRAAQGRPTRTKRLGRRIRVLIDQPARRPSRPRADTRPPLAPPPRRFERGRLSDGVCDRRTARGRRDSRGAREVLRTSSLHSAARRPHCLDGEWESAGLGALHHRGGRPLSPSCSPPGDPMAGSLLRMSP